MRARPNGEGPWWRDGDRRRAVLLSLFLHLAVMLFAIGAFTAPPPEPTPTYLVIEVGTPALAEVTVEAPAADAPAPDTPRPQVVDTRIGAPQAAAMPVPTPAAPEEVAETAQPEAPASAPEASTPTTVATPRPPVPALAPPVAAATVAPTQPRPTTPLPAITPPELVPTPLADRIPVPVPRVTNVIAEARAIDATPQVTVAAATAVPTPSVTAQVAGAQPVPTPNVSASVSAGAPVPIPGARVDVASARPVATPDVRASVAAARDVTAVPQVSVVAPTNVPIPAVRADVAPRPPAPSAPVIDAAARAAETDVASTRPDDGPAGGDAANPGQVGPADPNASASAAGLAASPDGSPNASGSAALPREAFAIDLFRPLFVLIDNYLGVPISGIAQASMIVEMPVEGGLSRIMLTFDRLDPERVGPVRSARDYFVELARRSDALLVHAGGSPSSIALIERTNLTTVDSFSPRGVTFERGEGSAPYNLFTFGSDLRAVVNRLDPGVTRRITGSIFRPLPTAPDARRIDVAFGASRSVFAYQEGLAAYQWFRSGEETFDADGRAVQVDAVLIGEIDARPVPLDPQGRLFVPLQGGRASFYLYGKRVDGTWRLVDGAGIRFVDDLGEEIDLAPYRVWVALTPTYGQHAALP